MHLADQLAAARVLPVITAHDVESTVTLATTLHRAGMTCIEITLRTEAGLASVQAVKSALPQLLVAAGTVTCAEHVEQAKDAGADLCLSPGISTFVLSAAAAADMPFVPGVATASEIMLGLAHNIEIFKLFPAVPLGGIALLKSFSGPFPDVRFCPTGGLGPDNYREFFELPNVLCCGGSWMVSDELVLSGRWNDIEVLARKAMTDDYVD